MRKRVIRAACHIHSDWSYDGKWSLAKLAAVFGHRGYQILLMAEHDRGFSEPRFFEYRKACARASSDRLFVCPGMEYSDRSNTVHTLVWGPVPFLGEGLPTLELLKTVKSRQGVAVLAHPSRNDAWRLFDPEWARWVSGIELWNRKMDGWAPSPQAPSLIISWNKIPFAGLDFHDRKQSFPLSMLLEVNNGLNEKSIIDCLVSGSCQPGIYGMKIREEWLGRSLPVLRLAEQGKRSLARKYKQIINRTSVKA